MDDSETYIKMCDCEEIRTEWKWKHGDCVAVKMLGGVRLGIVEWDNVYIRGQGFCQVVSDNCVPLPRQDQLQEMVRPRHITRLVEDLDKFTINCESCWIGNIQISMEQLWLAFVMKEKYRKVWNGEKWI